ncbi:MAG: rhomboid family intramembrane serine protease [Acidiferrobacterales bacterium]|nr:rhomboid family intramembrane serine protease [Acidiferrobacterales bacterium]
MKESFFTSLKREFIGIAVFVAVIWVVFILDRFLPLERFALFPRQLSGLPGILFSPFLHKDLSHIMANSVPLITLLALLAGSRANSARTVTFLILASGALLWAFGRSVPVIGASGLVFALIGFLIASGFFEKRPLAILVGLFVGFSYGGTLFFGILPGQSGISWDGHLFGAVGGVVCAWFLAR